MYSFGFTTTVIEMVNDGRIQDNAEFVHICFPTSSVKSALIKMRPWLRKGETCEGHSDATSYAIEALAAGCPCQKSKGHYRGLPTLDSSKLNW
jgi:hypothetical protein